jgi:hypothetical protein
LGSDFTLVRTNEALDNLVRRIEVDFTRLSARFARRRKKEYDKDAAGILLAPKTYAKKQNDGKLDFAWSLHPKVILPLFVELQQKKSCVKTVDGLKIYLEERLYKRL